MLRSKARVSEVKAEVETKDRVTLKKESVRQSAAEAVRGFQSEAVFTFLNRLAALKMMEARALVLAAEGISQDMKRLGIEKMVSTSYSSEKGLRSLMRW